MTVAEAVLGAPFTLPIPIANRGRLPYTRAAG
jgi:hypothetical protein